MIGTNLSGTLNTLRLLYNPQLCVPRLTVPTFADLPVPIPLPDGNPAKAVVLDKDNCFAEPHADTVWPQYAQKWDELRQYYSGDRLLIVSNTAGTADDKGLVQADRIEKGTGVKVLAHSTKKPGCYKEILSYFSQRGVSDPAQIAVVGDRLFTDVLMANLMGACGVWVSEGVKPSNNWIVKFEKAVYERVKRT